MTELIESLKPKNKRNQRYILVLAPSDDVVELLAETVMSEGLAEGMKITARQLEKIKTADQLERCRQRAWNLLAHRPRTRDELHTALRQRKFRAAICDQVIERLEELGYLDDQAFAKMFTEQAKMSSKNGPRMVYQKLRQKGVEEVTASRSADQLREGKHQEESARQLLEKWNRRSKPEDPLKRKQAAAGYLMRRGFDPELVWETVRQVLGEQDN